MIDVQKKQKKKIKAIYSTLYVKLDPESNMERNATNTVATPFQPAAENHPAIRPKNNAGIIRRLPAKMIGITPD
jgi:hypothetical protein